MPNTLPRLLCKTGPAVSPFVDRLEELSGYPSEDNRLVADLSASSNRQVAGLGLDPADTTAKELYHALLVAYERDSLSFAKAIGDKSSDSPNIRSSRLVQILANISGGQVWAMKHSAARGILRSHPPRRLMKRLGYRSVGSMLKRENITELWLALKLVESPRYLRSLAKSYAGLSANSFESKPAEVLVLPAKKWSEVASKNIMVTDAPEIGAIAVWPNDLAARTSRLSLTLLICQALEELHCRAMALKTHHLKPDFQKYLNKFWANEVEPATQIVGQPVFWRSLCRHYSQKQSDAYVSMFDPYVIDFDDLSDHTFTSLVHGLHVPLSRWPVGDYLLFSDLEGKMVSCNLTDVAANHAADASFSRRTLQVGRRNLWDELVSRYLAHKSVENYVRQKLDKNSPELEDKSVKLAGFSQSININLWSAEAI